MDKTKFKPADEFVDKVFGEIGTPARDAIEAEIAEELRAQRIGKAIKDARLLQNLTQEELGDLIGVKKSQISKIEGGNSNLTLTTIEKVFSALGITSGNLRLSNGQELLLW